MSSSNELDVEDEVTGPKAGVKISLDQANLIIKRHFPNFRVTNLIHINKGHNNRIYVVTAQSSNSKGNLVTDYILRLSGRFWSRFKTENEVCALLYLSKHCPSIRIPAVYGFCTDKNESGINAEYILMEKLNGVSLESIWNELNLDDKKRIMHQLAEMYCKMQKMHFPCIGSFRFTSDIGNAFGIGVDPQKEVLGGKKIIRIGEVVEFEKLLEGGPHDTYADYFKSACKNELNFLRESEFMKDYEDYEKRIARIENFAESLSSPTTNPKGLEEDALNVPFVFTHGHMEPGNVMVNKDTLEITGLLDFEFAGAYPVDNDWFAGFYFVDVATSDERAFNEVGPYSSADEEEERVALRNYFLSEMRKHGGVVPDDIPGHLTRAELYYFISYISPHWFREERDTIPESDYGDRKDACRRVDGVLNKYGF